MWNSYNMNFKKTYFRTVTDQRGYLEKKTLVILCKKTQAEQVAAPNVAKYAETDTCIADIAFIFGKHLHKIKVLHNLRCLLPIQATTKKSQLSCCMHLILWLLN